MADPTSLDFLLALAFGAGILGFFSPCAVAMLPAYLAYFLGKRASPPGVPLGREGAADGGGLPWAVAAAALALAAGGALLLTALVNSVRLGDASLAPSQAILSTSGLALFVVGIALFAYGHTRGQGFRPLWDGAVRGLRVGAITTGGLATVFALLGLLVLGGASAVQRYLPEVVLATAGAVVVLGILMLLGRSPSFIPALRAPGGRSYFSFYAFGMAYALVSTGCNLPVFLLVVGLSLQAATTAVGGTLLVFLAYTGGSALVMVLVSIYLAMAHRATVPWLGRLLPYLHRVSGAAVLAMGLYILWYDLTFLFPAT
jgi:cytochrome c biogenesis protein CcdA